MTQAIKSGPDAGPARLVLKIDVDTKVGLMDGVPRLMTLLGGLGVTASFYVAMGPDHSGRALKRLFRPGFLRKQLRSGAASAYGPRTMLYGLLLPGPIIARSAPALLGRLMAAGFEVGLHGWDHVFWHDRLRGLGRERLLAELGQAYNLFLELTGSAPASFASPGWQITDGAMTALCDLGISHVSCTRGREPFRPLVEGRALPILELPTTLPSLDELMDAGHSAEAAGKELSGMVDAGLHVFTLHGEVEGRELLPVFEAMCRRMLARGVRFLRLVDAAREVLAAGPPPARALGWREVPGRAYQVACPLGEGPA